MKWNAVSRKCLVNVSYHIISHSVITVEMFRKLIFLSLNLPSEAKGLHHVTNKCTLAERCQHSCPFCFPSFFTIRTFIREVLWSCGSRLCDQEMRRLSHLSSLWLLWRVLFMMLPCQLQVSGSMFYWDSRILVQIIVSIKI